MMSKIRKGRSNKIGVHVTHKDDNDKAKETILRDMLGDDLYEDLISEMTAGLLVRELEEEKESLELFAEMIYRNNDIVDLYRDDSVYNNAVLESLRGHSQVIKKWSNEELKKYEWMHQYVSQVEDYVQRLETLAEMSDLGSLNSNLMILTLPDKVKCSISAFLNLFKIKMNSDEDSSKLLVMYQRCGLETLFSIIEDMKAMVLDALTKCENSCSSYDIAVPLIKKEFELRHIAKLSQDIFSIGLGSCLSRFEEGSVVSFCSDRIEDSGYTSIFHGELEMVTESNLEDETEGNLEDETYGMVKDAVDEPRYSMDSESMFDLTSGPKTHLFDMVLDYTKYLYKEIIYIVSQTKNQDKSLHTVFEFYMSMINLISAYRNGMPGFWIRYSLSRDIAIVEKLVLENQDRGKRG